MSQQKLLQLTGIIALFAAFLFASTKVVLADPPKDNKNPTPAPQLTRLPIKPFSDNTPSIADNFLSNDDANPQVTPERVVVSLNPGASHSTNINVFTGDIPFGKGDVMFVFDRTGSMGDEINQAKTSAVDIMNNIREKLPNTWYGVASFMDYPGYYSYPGYSEEYGSSAYGDVPWELNINPTDNITDVASVINNLWLGGGSDWPEDYTRVLYEASQVKSVGWREKAKRIIVLFGDAPTHDLNFAGYNFGGDPGSDAVALTDDDLDFETVVQQVAEADISVIAVDSGYTPESEATFKGMSIGYAAASGTNGAYFNLTDASDIPSITVDLIVAETQVIDKLSLKTTEGYESWVKFEPAEFLSVGSNVTKTFDVSITVPSGTTPGFYPFIVQAIGDGAILGVSYIEVTVPTSSPISDIGFKPNRDGFKHANESSMQTWDMFEQFFGSEQVEYPNGNRIHAADVFYEHIYRKAGEGGSCDGFSAVSLLNYKHLTQPNAGDFAMSYYSPLYSQKKNEDITQATAFSQGIFVGYEVYHYFSRMCELLGSSRAYYDFLKNQLQNDSPAILSIYVTKDYYIDLPLLPPERVLEKGTGHSLVPYRYEEPNSNTAYVYVYDSNLPGNDKHRVEFDFTTNTWSYDYHVPYWTDITLEEIVDKDNCTLGVIPVELYRHKGLAWWTIDQDFTYTVSSTQVNPAQLYAASGPATLLITDDEGRRLGWDHQNFYDEIPGASYLPALHGDGVPSSGYYYIPANVLHHTQIYAEAEGKANVSSWSGGHLVQLSNMDVITGTVVDLNFPSDGSSLSVTGTTTATQASFSISQLVPGEDRTVSIGNIPLDPGEEVLFQYLLDDTKPLTETINLSTSSSISRTFDLSLHRAGLEGYTVFGHASLTFEANSDTFIQPNNWSELDTVEISIDRDKDGLIDETYAVPNQTDVSSISLEASQTVIYTGAKSVNIIVGVRDQFGAYVTDGTPVQFSTNLGTLSREEGTTTGGLIHLILTSGNEAGTATVKAEVGGVENALEISFIDYQLYLSFVQTPVTRLTSGAGNNLEPSFSPNGEDIVFASDRDGNWEIYSMKKDGSAQTRLTNTPTLDEDLPSFSSDGKSIIFSASDGQDEDIFLMNLDGANIRNISNSPTSNEGRAKFLPSGSSVVFDSDRNGNWEIYIAAMDENRLTNIKQITNLPDSDDRLPTFIASENKILFRSQERDIGSASSRIYTINFDGTSLTKISGDSTDWSPVASFDGKWVAFISDRFGNPDIFTMRIDGASVQRITTASNEDATPSFSPNGQYLVFASALGSGGFDLYLLPITLTD